MLKKILFPLVLLCALLAAATVSAAKQTPMERVKEGADKLIKVLSDPALQDEAKHDEAISTLRKTAEEYIDFRLVTMYSVGKPWLKMSEQMQSDLTEAFVQLLERTYLKRIPAYGGQEVKYDKELVAGKKAKVFTEIIDKDKKIVVEFRLRDTGEQWMIYDVVAEGVSLVANYRSQFSEILDTGSPEDLLNLIRERIQKLDRGEVDASEDKVQG
ncbi:ABC transporter substrate-binding protein [Pseudodesulfovibrio cashew]|uniref:ABC transporter substrate-binding protein n=1 Tax=Pseudodesulfovibrio cashew TaxID=2678688 RepID=A0A6I6JFJ7_9BACT|nr:ABC transporter substrate-binding protein [Pseudodesulfovibrio cashew]QGY39949.1 ABC transporter substrate-binding protein [Pseudodesulfovibrio cashew]